MAVMSPVERWACCNPVWRSFTTRFVVPWACAGAEVEGEVLELGTGAGANAAALLARFPRTRLTATDLDPRMVTAARSRLAPFGARATVCGADATALDFPPAAFDTVVSMLMLHHVGDWESVLSEAARVLRPGGRLLGYDLTAVRPTLPRHGRAEHGHVFVSPGDLRARIQGVGLVDVRVETALGRTVMRFSARKP